jgi:hypothetical protein
MVPILTLDGPPFLHFNFSAFLYTPYARNLADSQVKEMPSWFLCTLHENLVDSYVQGCLAEFPTCRKSPRASQILIA